MNSEKTKPYFVHVAPINDEVEQLYQKLYEKGFVWENGKPGDGKTMLAYHALFRYRKRIGISYHYSIRLSWLKYRVYQLNLNNVKDDKEIDAILEELDTKKGGKRKIILIDDAHKLNFEDRLRFEFEEEAKEKLNGKFVWINTNYLETNKSDATDSFNIDFETFYPKLIESLYNSQNPIIKEIIKNKCAGLQDAILLKEQGRIKDPWHFNFVASNGEQRIIELLTKLSSKNDEHVILLLSIFLFSVRNIITGEKEFNQTEFTNLLSNIENPYFKKNIEIYQPAKIISDLGSQEKGRFIIIENKNSLDRGFLHAPHVRLSKAIITSITQILTDENLIKQMIDSSKLLLTNDFRDSKYFKIYFDLLGKYQEYFLNENKGWITNYLTNIILDQLLSYSFLLSILKKSHKTFYSELVTDEYIHTVASKISLTNANRFTAIQAFIQALGNDKQQLIDKLVWVSLAETVNKAEVSQFTQIADFINVLGTYENKQQLIDKLDWVALAKAANKAEVTQFSQIANFINALRIDEDKQQLIEKLDWITLAKTANKAEMDQIPQIAHFLNALGTYEKKQQLIDKLDWVIIAKNVNKAQVNQFTRIATFVNALGTDKEKQKIIERMDWETLANTANKAEVDQFSQLEALLNALGTDKEKQKVIEKLDWETLAKTANKAEVIQFGQLEALLNALGTDKEKQKVIGKLDWETLANKANKAEVNHLEQIANFINALKADSNKFSIFLDLDIVINWSRYIIPNQLSHFCLIVSRLDEEMQNLAICKIEWSFLLKKLIICHKYHIRVLANILYFQNKKDKLINDLADKAEVKEYLANHQNEIIRYAAQYFDIPLDFQTLAYLLLQLYPYSLELSNKIADKIKFKIGSDFNITPRYYQNFSNLLNSINCFNPSISRFIIMNGNVWNKLMISFRKDDFEDQTRGLQSLLETIKNIDHNRFGKLTEKRIQKYVVNINEE